MSDKPSEKQPANVAGSSPSNEEEQSGTPSPPRSVHTSPVPMARIPRIQYRPEVVTGLDVASEGPHPTRPELSRDRVATWNVHPPEPDVLAHSMISNNSDPSPDGNSRLFEGPANDYTGRTVRDWSLAASRSRSPTLPQTSQTPSDVVETGSRGRRPGYPYPLHTQWMIPPAASDRGESSSSSMQPVAQLSESLELVDRMSSMHPRVYDAIQPSASSGAQGDSTRTSMSLNDPDSSYQGVLASSHSSGLRTPPPGEVGEVEMWPRSFTLSTSDSAAVPSTDSVTEPSTDSGIGPSIVSDPVEEQIVAPQEVHLELHPQEDSDLDPEEDSELDEEVDVDLDPEQESEIDPEQDLELHTLQSLDSSIEPVVLQNQSIEPVVLQNQRIEPVVLQNQSIEDPLHSVQLVEEKEEPGYEADVDTAATRSPPAKRQKRRNNKE